MFTYFPIFLYLLGFFQNTCGLTSARSRSCGRPAASRSQLGVRFCHRNWHLCFLLFLFFPSKLASPFFFCFLISHQNDRLFVLSIDSQLPLISKSSKNLFGPRLQNKFSFSFFPLCKKSEWFQNFYFYQCAAKLPEVHFLF